MGVTTNIYVTNVETYARLMDYSPDDTEGDGIELLHQIHTEFGWRKCTVFMARDMFYPIMQVRQQKPSEIYQLLEEDLWAKISHEVMVLPHDQKSGKLIPKSELLFTYRITEQIDPRSNKFKEQVNSIQNHPFCRFRIGREESEYPVDSTDHVNKSLFFCKDDSMDDIDAETTTPISKSKRRRQSAPSARKASRTRS